MDSTRFLTMELRGCYVMTLRSWREKRGQVPQHRRGSRRDAHGEHGRTAPLGSKYLDAPARKVCLRSCRRVSIAGFREPRSHGLRDPEVLGDREPLCVPWVPRRAHARAVTNGTGHLNREEAKWKIKPYKLPLRDEHLDLLFDSLDKRNAGHFPLDSLLSALRVPVSFDRKQQIEATYDRLARQAENGKLTMADLMRYYDPSIDSRVGANVISEENAVIE
ncbi:hypothetical protein FI667_g13461, partial [Globisporangium splendens]